MADTKISDLTAVVTPALTDTTVVVQGGVTKKETLTQIRTVMVPIVLTADVSGTLPVANGGTGITALGTGVATWWGTPSSANLAAAVTDETGSGALVFANTPTLVTPVIGAATGTSLAASSFVSAGGTVATAGAFRLANNDSIQSKTSGGVDVKLVELTGGNHLNIGQATGITSADFEAQTSIAIASSSVTIGSASTTRLTVSSSGILADLSLLILDSDQSNYYTIAPGDIGGSYTLNLPVVAAHDTFCVLALAQTLTNKTISLGSNTLTCTSAQLATACSDETGSGALVFANTPTLVTPAIGAATGASVALSSFWSTGASPATTGAGRMSNAEGINFRSVVGGNPDISGMFFSSGNILFLGTDSSFTAANQASGIRLYPTTGGDVNMGVAGTTYMSIVGGNVEAWKPITGSASGTSPHGVHGGVAYTFAADANYTVTAAQYALDWLEFVTGVITAGRTVTFPHPASKAVGYYKTIFNNTNQTLTVSTGTGTTKTIATGLAQRFWFDNAGVSFSSATFTP